MIGGAVHGADWIEGEGAGDWNGIAWKFSQNVELVWPCSTPPRRPPRACSKSIQARFLFGGTGWYVLAWITLCTMAWVDILPGHQDSYNLAFSNFLGADIACYPPMQYDIHAGIGASSSEGITVMDDPIYGSLGSASILLLLS